MIVSTDDPFTAYYWRDETTGRPDYRLLRRIRRDPTVALMRGLISAAITSAPWSLEADDGVPPERVAFAQKELNRVRDIVVNRSILGGVDFGWAALYMPMDLSDGRSAHLGRPVPLLPDITDIHADADGDVAYLTQTTPTAGEKILWADDLFVIRWRVEESAYGEPLLINVRDVFRQWHDVSATANRYDRKIAGSQIVIKFPPGSSLDRDGVERDNVDIAKEMIRRIEASGAVAIEQRAGESLAGLQADNPEWSFEVLRNPNAQPEFIERMTYLDRLKVRGMGFPERAVLEAESSGSRADSITAAGFAIRNLEMAGHFIAKEIDAQLLDPLMRANYGDGAVDTIRYVAGPVDDMHKRELFNLAAEVAKGRPETVDLDTLYDNVAIPKSAEVLRGLVAGGVKANDD